MPKEAQNLLKVVMILKDLQEETKTKISPKKMKVDHKDLQKNGLKDAMLRQRMLN